MCKTVTEPVTESYTVQVPYTERRTANRKVCKVTPVTEMRTVTEDQGHWEQVAVAASAAPVASPCATGYGAVDGCGTVATGCGCNTGCGCASPCNTGCGGCGQVAASPCGGCGQVAAAAPACSKWVSNIVGKENRIHSEQERMGQAALYLHAFCKLASQKLAPRPVNVTSRIRSRLAPFLMLSARPKTAGERWYLERTSSSSHHKKARGHEERSSHPRRDVHREHVRDSFERREETYTVMKNEAKTREETYTVMVPETKNHEEWSTVMNQVPETKNQISPSWFLIRKLRRSRYGLGIVLTPSRFKFRSAPAVRLLPLAVAVPLLLPPLVVAASNFCRVVDPIETQGRDASLL